MLLKKEKLRKMNVYTKGSGRKQRMWLMDTVWILFPLDCVTGVPNYRMSSALHKNFQTVSSYHNLIFAKKSIFSSRKVLLQKKSPHSLAYKSHMTYQRPTKWLMCSIKSEFNKNIHIIVRKVPHTKWEMKRCNTEVNITEKNRILTRNIKIPNTEIKDCKLTSF